MLCNFFIFSTKEQDWSMKIHGPFIFQFCIYCYRKERKKIFRKVTFNENYRLIKNLLILYIIRKKL